MKKKRLKKWSYLMMTFLTAATLLTSALGNEKTVTASPTPGTVQNTVPDNTSQRSVTIHKYKVPNYGALEDRDTGEILADKVAHLKPYPGVHFKISKVIPKNNLVSLVSWPENKDDYTVDENFKPKEAVTNSAGEILFDLGTGKAADGIYLVEEDHFTDGKDNYGTMLPFFVNVPQTDRATHQGLVYDINVYPKNVFGETMKPIKTVEGQEKYSDHAGKALHFDVTVNVPDGLYYTPKVDQTINVYEGGSFQPTGTEEIKAGVPVTADTFEIEDNFATNLIYKNLKVEYTKDGITWEPLPAGDYEIIKDIIEAPDNPVESFPHIFEKNHNKVTVAFNDAAKKKMVEDNYKKLKVTYEVKTQMPKEGIGFGTTRDIDNRAYTNLKTKGVPLIREVSNTVTYTFGSFEIRKTDASNENLKLKGAEFKFALSKEDAEAGRFLQDEDGVDYSATTNENGVAYAEGLYVDVHTGWNKTKYYVVETKAPKGYELEQDVKEVTIGVNADDEGFPNLLEVTNKRSTLLPFTGAEGVGPIVALAMVIMLIGVGAVILERRIRSAE